MRHLRNTLTILIATALTALVFYVGVEATTEIVAATTGTTTSAVASAGQTYLCPVSGCTSTSCHAITGTSAQQGDASTASSDGGGETMTCPRTGCTASSCHGATGSPPPSGGGYGRGRRGSSADGGIIYE